jgi:CubicO group peptidase (beta-lactamase class C family)
MPFGRGGDRRDWDGATLDRAGAVAQRQGGRGWAAWEDGRLVGSWRTHYRGPVLSVTKAIAGLACARAIGEGWLKPGEAAAATLGEWRGEPGRERITLRMLWQMTAGLEDGARALYRPGIEDKGRAALGLQLVDEPGERFRYGPACWEVLGEVLRRKAQARGESLEGFVQRVVIRPLRLSAANWRADGRGRWFLSTGAELNLTELGRLGRAIAALAAGEETAGISPDAFRAVTAPSAANPMFGGGVWSNRGASRGHGIEVEEALDPPREPGFWNGACLSAAQPSSMLALIGSAGQRVFIWPGERRVFARLGYSGDWRDGPLLRVV